MRRALVIVASLVLVAPLSAQSLLYRPPNLSGTWIPDPGVVQFNFAHRFRVAPASGGNKVTNFPSFTVAVGIVRTVGLGLHYGSNSLLVSSPQDYRPNEIELLARWRPLGTEGRDGLSVAVTPAYNRAARSVDAEASADYTMRALTLSGAARYINRLSGRVGESDVALAGGATIRVNRYVAMSGDVAKLLDQDTTVAWSAGIVLVIPGSPHTFSLHASKAVTNTIQSSSIGGPNVLYGFEFTIPLHLSRFSPWFKKSGGAGSDAAARPAEAGVTEIRIRGFKFPETTTIAAGQTVRWVNDDPVDHTITLDAGDVSSPLIKQGSPFSYKFDQVGTYTYHCTPHPFMKGTIVVQ